MHTVFLGNKRPGNLIVRTQTLDSLPRFKSSSNSYFDLGEHHREGHLGSQQEGCEDSMI